MVLVILVLLRSWDDGEEAEQPASQAGPACLPPAWLWDGWLLLLLLLLITPS